MKREILNRRRILLAGFNQKTERDWYEFLQRIEEADSLEGETGIHHYFNTQPNASQPQLGNQKELYFSISLEIFKAILEKQKQGEAIYNQNAPNQVVLPSLKGIHESYDVLITMVGFSPQPLMHTLLSINPKRVYLIATQESQFFQKTIRIKDYFDFLIRQYGNGVKIAVEEPILVKEIGSFDTFKKVKQIINDNEGKKIAIDITGGKKSMDSSAFLVGAITDNVDIFYVDFEEYENNRPVYGTEFLNKLDNPYKLYNVKEEELIKEFWKRKDFAIVAEIASRLLKDFTEEKASNYDLSEKRKEFQAIQNAARCYEAWSKFDYKTAFTHKGFSYFTEHQGLVDTLKDCQNSRWTAKGAIYLAIDRWMRGNDNLEEDKNGNPKDIDKTALRYTQAIECLSYFRLYNKSRYLNNSQVINLQSNHFELSKLINFLYNDSGHLINQISQITWNDSTQRFPAGTIPSSSSIIPKLHTRNNIAHFSCFDRTLNKARVTLLGNAAKQYIELFMKHDDYKLHFDKSFVDLQKQFKFPTYEELIQSCNQQTTTP